MRRPKDQPMKTSLPKNLKLQEASNQNKKHTHPWKSVLVKSLFYAIKQYEQTYEIIPSYKKCLLKDDFLSTYPCLPLLQLQQKKLQNKNQIQIYQFSHKLFITTSFIFQMHDHFIPIYELKTYISIYFQKHEWERVCWLSIL